MTTCFGPGPLQALSPARTVPPVAIPSSIKRTTRPRTGTGAPPAEIGLAPALDLLELLADLRRDVVGRGAGEPLELRIEDDLRVLAVDDGADPQLRMARRAELAHEQDVERRVSASATS